ncbi:crossover junction endodeoxyribonuclease RuvC [Candidatus Peribacteria bacterium]|nr:crossover junction endodeoxyribonuclease RuvC [Candidatus Peribacteria bacterium]
MRILGIDPGLTTTGIGIIEAFPQSMRAVDWCTITTSPTTPLPERLAEIARDAEGIMAKYAPDLAVVEQVFFAKNARTAIGVAHARGVLMMLASSRGMPVLEVTPMQLKSAIAGDGAADKQQLSSMLLRWINLTVIPTPADAADALALAVYGALHGKELARIGSGK